MKLALIAATGLLLSGASAYAQSAAPSGPPAPEAAAPSEAAPAPDADVTSAAPAAAGEAQSFSDEQINDFASAMVKIQKVAGDASIDDAEKQSQMVAIVQAEGLDAETFNAIGSASQSDPEVRERVQVAFASAQSQTQAQ